ncbi:MAG: phosphatase PAP2 family protein [Dehalococcoidia bacterium]|nr:phosphatase PAP2 family protein [Dehalococcoidia bacterium]
MNQSLSRKGMLSIGGLAVLATVLCICAHWEPRFPGDLRLTLAIQSPASGTLDTVMEWVSRLNGGWRVPVLAVAGSIVVCRWLGKLEAVLVLMTGLSSPIQSGLKLLVDRPRPTPDLVRVFQAEAGNGFPSGHAFFAMAFWGLLAYFAYTRLQTRSLRVLAFSASVVIVLWIGASRVYLGAHWPSDVLGGYVLGALFLMGLIWLDRRRKPHVETGRQDEEARTGSYVH